MPFDLIVDPLAVLIGTTPTHFIKRLWKTKTFVPTLAAWKRASQSGLLNLRPLAGVTLSEKYCVFRINPWLVGTERQPMVGLLDPQMARLWLQVSLLQDFKPLLLGYHYLPCVKLRDEQGIWDVIERPFAVNNFEFLL